MSGDQVHNVSIRIGSKIIEKWANYSIENDMLHPCDAFHLELGGAPREAWELCKLDSPVQILIDDTVVISGYLDDRDRNVERDGSRLTVAGRNKSARLVDESMPLQSLEGLTTRELVLRAIRPWYNDVTVSNATNRAAVRGRGAPLARVSKEPQGLDDRLRAKHTVKGKEKHIKVSPGESRWAVIQRFLEDDGLLAWGTADGKSIVVGQPCYDQEPQFSFFLPKPGSDRWQTGNVTGWNYGESVAERYSQITAVALGVDDSYNYSGTVKNGPGPSGEGKDFTAPKSLMIADSRIVSQDDAILRAQREMDERDGQGRRLSIRVRGHNQLRLANRPPALYACDTMARIEDEELGIVELWLITKVEFQHSEAGETTQLQLVAKGTVLKA